MTMGFVDWNERQNRRIAEHPVRYWLVTAAILAAWIALVHTLGPDRPVVWPSVVLSVLGFPTIAVGVTWYRHRRREPPADGPR